MRSGSYSYDQLCPFTLEIGICRRLFSRAEFTAPPVGAVVQGTEARNHYKNPGLLNIDASVIKQFGYTHGDRTYLLKVRGDFYNVINRTNLTGVPVTWPRPRSGAPPTTISLERSSLALASSFSSVSEDVLGSFLQ